MLPLQVYCTGEMGHWVGHECQSRDGEGSENAGTKPRGWRNGERSQASTMESDKNEHKGMREQVKS